MTRASMLRLLALGFTAAACASAALAQTPTPSDKQVYRYVDRDGRVVYTDRPPASDVKGFQTKKLGPNFIETDEVPLAAQQAAERFPVTLFTFPCGEICDNAVALLNRRGVPHAVVDVQSLEGGKKLIALTGEQNAPVLQVGDRTIVKGYNEARWQSALDEAGYPKTPAPRRAQPGPSATPAPKAAPRTDMQTQAIAPREGGYPAQ